MADEATTLSILRTKLHRPPVPSDHVHRPRLLERLEQRRYRPLTVKGHLKNIYQKLQVSNRRQAVSRAKEIEIL